MCIRDSLMDLKNYLIRQCELSGVKIETGAEADAAKVKEVNPDAILVSDPGVFAIVKEVMPEMNVHISTQENNTNYITCRFWWNQGATRVVSARDLSLEELKEIKTKIPEEMQMEIFVHGAMCMSYSGRCLISNFMADRSANRGKCAHCCRWHCAAAALRSRARRSRRRRRSARR